MNIALPRRLPDDERRSHIFAAAERAFLRHGFHAATMSQVAEEAGMSAGNLYRYFRSKEAIVEGLCQADQVERSEAFAKLANAQDIKAAMQAALQEHVLGCPPEKARMIIEIWAESGRNARVAPLTRQLDNEVIQGLVELIELAKARGAAAFSLDARFAASLLFTLVAGLFKRKAMEPDLDMRAEAAGVVGVLEALFAGALSPRAEV